MYQISAPLYQRALTGLELAMLAASPLPAPIFAHPVTRELGGLDPIWPRQGGLPSEQFFCPSPFPVL